MDADPKRRDDAKLLQILALLPPDRRQDRVERPQDSDVPQRFAPSPQRNQAVAFVKIDLAAVIGNRLGNIEEKFADQGFCANRTQLLGKRRRIVDVEKDEDLFLQHWSVIGAEREVEEGFDTDEMSSSHHDDANNGERDYHRDHHRQPAIRHRQFVKWPKHHVSDMDGDQEQDNHHNRVNHNRAQRMDIADPPAPQALDIKLLKETDSNADKNGVDNAKDDRAPVGAGHQPRQYRKDHDGQQDRRQFASCRNRERSEGKVHGRRDRAYFSQWQDGHCATYTASPCCGLPLPGGRPAPSGPMLMSHTAISSGVAGRPRSGVSANVAVDRKSMAEAALKCLGIDMPDLPVLADRPAGYAVEGIERLGAAFGDQRSARL